MKHVTVNRKMRRSVPHDHMVVLSKAAELTHDVDMLNALVLVYSTTLEEYRQTYINNILEEIKKEVANDTNT